MRLPIHADYLNLTVPADRAADLCSIVQPYLDMAGGVAETPEITRVGAGVCKRALLHRVGVLGLSGGALEVLRNGCLLGPLLVDVGSSLPHRVTRLDLARDEKRDAVPSLRRIYTAGRRGQVSLSRKSVPASAVTKYVAPSVYGGPDTGTVYLGGADARVRGCVYDKRQERLQKGHPDPGPWLRLEVRVRGVGVTLRDVIDPEPAFYHFAAPSLCLRPPGVAAWEARSEGYALEPLDRPTPYARLLRRLDTSAELHQLVDLARQCGPHGVEMLLHKLGKIAAAPPATTAAGPGDAMRQRKAS
jgi:hypothetical protein